MPKRKKFANKSRPGFSLNEPRGSNLGAVDPSFWIQWSLLFLVGSFCLGKVWIQPTICILSWGSYPRCGWLGGCLVATGCPRELCCSASSHSRTKVTFSISRTFSGFDINSSWHNETLRSDDILYFTMSRISNSSSKTWFTIAKLSHSSIWDQ